MSRDNKLRRIEVKIKNPNPNFVKWLEELLENTKKSEKKSQFIVKEALESLKKYPLPLATGRDCAILRGFGTKLCNFIDEKLEIYKQLYSDAYNNSINYDIDIKSIAKKYSEKKTIYKTQSEITQNQIENAKTDIEYKQVIMSSGSFDIILLVDTQETSGKSKTYLDSTRRYLQSHKIKYEIRRLNIGDFCWICRDKENNELVAPYIIERKRMDDFASSIRDGRFHEQKFRLKNCGIPNIIYLIENYGNNQHISLPLQNLMQAATNTQIHNNFQIKLTDNHHETISYISVLTQILIEQFKDKVLIGTEKEEVKKSDINSTFFGMIKFNEFNTQSKKSNSMCVKNVFLKQLLQLKTLSTDKALAITKIYPTPKSLMLGYESCFTKEEAENLLTNIPSGKLDRPVGVALSKIVYQFYN